MIYQNGQKILKSVPLIRPARIEDASEMARVHVDTWRTSYIGIVPDEHLAKLSYEQCQAGWVEHLSNYPDEITYVGETEAGQIVALASGGAIREPLPEFDGELYVLYVLKDFQKLGYGRRLLFEIAKDLSINGFHSMVIWVLKDNRDRRFYEGLCGKLFAEKIVEIGGKPLVDVAYTWKDLPVFTAHY